MKIQLYQMMSLIHCNVPYTTRKMNEMEDIPFPAVPPSVLALTNVTVRRAPHHHRHDHAYYI